MLRTVAICRAVALCLDSTSAFSLRAPSVVHGSSFAKQMHSLKNTCRLQGPRVHAQSRRGGIRMGLFDSLVKLAMPTEVTRNLDSIYEQFPNLRVCCGRLSTLRIRRLMWLQHLKSFRGSVPFDNSTLFYLR